jgi:hypothetical protein
MTNAPDSTASPATGGLGLAGQDRLIQVKIGRRQQGPIRDQLIARLHDHEIVDDELLGRQRSVLPVAADSRGRRDQQREPIERPLRARFLDDPDRRVGHDDAEEQGVAHVAEDQRQGPEDGQDKVEHRQDDARVGPARLSPPRATRGGQPPLRLGTAQSRRGEIPPRQPWTGDGRRAAAGRTCHGHVATGHRGGL